MLMLRKIHLYLGSLFAPTIIFFAFSGLLQTFGLHEAERGDPHQPPAWIVTLASLHKNQQLSRPKNRRRMAAPPAGAPAVAPAAGAPPAPAAAATFSLHTMLKVFVLLMAVGLIVSTVLGILIALKNSRTRTAALAMMAIGIVLPFVLLL